MRFAAAALAAMLLVACPIHGHEGWGVVIHDRLGIVVSDIPGNTVWRIVGNRVEPLVRSIHSHQLVSGSDGAIYGTNVEPDGKLTSVWRVDSAGRFSYVLPPASDSPLGLQSFLITDDGTIYTTNRYDHKRPTIVLLKREPDGRISNVAGAAQGFADGVGVNARFGGIDGMRQAADGTLVVADGAHLRTITQDGHVSTVTSPLTSRRWGEDLLGISSIRTGTVFVADHAGRRVLRVRLANMQVEEIDRSDFLWAPAGVELTQRDMYVLEHLRPPLSMLGDLQIGPYLRVRRVEPGRSSTTLALVWGRHSRKAAAGIVAFALLTIWAGNRLRLRRLRRTVG